MNKELMEALDILEKEKNISKDTLLEAIEQSLIQACKNHFGKADNVHVTINPETCDFAVYADRRRCRRCRGSCNGDFTGRCTEDRLPELRSVEWFRFRSSQRNSDVSQHRMPRT